MESNACGGPSLAREQRSKNRPKKGSFEVRVPYGTALLVLVPGSEDTGTVY
jgi:hypothetical protein